MIRDNKDYYHLSKKRKQRTAPRARLCR